MQTDISRLKVNGDGMKVNKTVMAILLGTLTSGLLNDAEAAIAPTERGRFSPARRRVLP